MRTIFILSFIANLLLVLASLAAGPSTVAIHFGAGGKPDGWAPSIVHAPITASVHLLVFLSLFYAPLLLRIMPNRWINLPNRSYWLRDENRGRMEEILAQHLHAFGAATFVFMFLVGLLSIQANLSDPVRLREDLFWWVFGLYMAYVVYWTVRILQAFRVPHRRTS